MSLIPKNIIFVVSVHFLLFIFLPCDDRLYHKNTKHFLSQVPRLLLSCVLGLVVHIIHYACFLVFLLVSNAAGFFSRKVPLRV